MADADHLIGFLALTVISLAAAEVARPLRYCLVPLGGALMVTPFLFGASGIHSATSVAIGLLLVALSFRRGKIRAHYGSRSEEHTAELQSLMRISYAVFCLKKKTHKQKQPTI